MADVLTALYASFQFFIEDEQDVYTAQPTLINNCI